MKEQLIITIAIILLVGIAINITLSLKWLKIRKEKVTIKKIPSKAEGVKILQISDLHSNSSTKMNVNIWSKIAALHYDIVVITGDIVNSNANQITPHLNGLRKLTAKTPVYFCSGNHDYYGGYEELCNKLIKAGVKVLNNEMCTLSDKGIEIIGLTDYQYGDKKNTTKLFPPKKQNIIRIVIAHQPRSFEIAKQLHAELTIVGHTHGGQVRMPFIKTLYAPGSGIFPQYGYGLYRHENSQLYVSKGIGHTFFPIRFWNRPEITLLEFRGEE